MIVRCTLNNFIGSLLCQVDIKTLILNNKVNGLNEQKNILGMTMNRTSLHFNTVIKMN